MKTFITTFSRLFIGGLIVFIILVVVLSFFDKGAVSLAGVILILGGVFFALVSLAGAIIAAVMDKADRKYYPKEEKKGR